MTIQKPPQEPANTTTHGCEVVIFGIKRTILKISPHFHKRNEEFRQSQKKKVRENLSQYLLDDKVIEDFIQQLREEEVWFEGVNLNWPALKYYGCASVVDQRNGLKYLIIFFLDDNNPETIGVITVYPCE